MLTTKNRDFLFYKHANKTWWTVFVQPVLAAFGCQFEPQTLCRASLCQFCSHNMWRVSCCFAAYYHFSRMFAGLVLPTQCCFPSALMSLICVLVLITPLWVSYDISPCLFYHSIKQAYTLTDTHKTILTFIFGVEWFQTHVIWTRSVSRPSREHVSCSFNRCVQRFASHLVM